MTGEYDTLADSLTMTEIIRLQDVLSRALVRRFEKRVALAFSDIVGVTPYCAKFGDEAGRKLQQRHVDLVARASATEGGRIVDTAGDGAFLCFATADGAIRAMVGLHRQIASDNDDRQADERLSVRIGCHVGPVLTDGVQVSGDSVNLCSRIAGSASAGEIRLSRQAFGELTDVVTRLACRRLKAVTLKGVEAPVEAFSLDWHDHAAFPGAVRFDDGSVLPLPRQDVIRFGRLKEHDGGLANDIVLQTVNAADVNRVSRWHFELHRRSAGFVLHAISDAVTEIDGALVLKGHQAPVKVGSIVRVGDVMSLEFIRDPAIETSDATFVQC